MIRFLFSILILFSVFSCTKDGPAGPMGPTGPAGSNGQNSSCSNASYYWTNGFLSSSIANVWQETSPAISVTAPTSGNYLIYASGRGVVTSSSTCIIMRLVDGNNSQILSATCVCGQTGVQGTGSISRIVYLNAGQALRMQFMSGANGANWQYGGDVGLAPYKSDKISFV